MKTIKTAGKEISPSFYLDDYEVYELNNVVRIKTHHTLFDSTYDFGWDVVINDTIETKNSREQTNPKYFFCDTLLEDAFGHWVFESAIYIPLYWKLKKEHPNLKWLLNNRKHFKEVLLKGAGLQEDDIVYNIDSYENTFYFPFYTSHHDLTLDTKYKDKLKKFHEFFMNRFGTVEKTVDFLYLPRGIKENYVENDRLLTCQEELIQYFSKKPNSKVLMTDTIDNFIEQLKILLSAKTIVLDYGSSFIVNSFFAKDSHVICIGFDVHHIIQIGQVMLTECIKENGTTFEFINKLHEEGNKPKKHYFSLEEIYSRVASKS